MSKRTIQTQLRNCLTDIDGIRVGHAHNARVNTGVSVIIPDTQMMCAVDVRGGGPGTRETDALGPSGLIDKVDGIVLSGGSVYGLAAADGACRWLGANGRGYAASLKPDVPRSPIVPSAILFDNANGGDKAWGMTPPFLDLGIKACEEAAHISDSGLKDGRIGAGYGAKAGTHMGGLGTASERIGDIVISAMIAANPVGSPYMPDSECFWAWPFEIDGEFGGVRPDPKWQNNTAPNDTKLGEIKGAGAATVIGVIATNATLTQRQLARLAAMAHDGMALAVQPSHTPLDGDTLFALSSEQLALSSLDMGVDPKALAWLGAAAARCVARALTRGVYFGARSNPK